MKTKLLSITMAMVVAFFFISSQLNAQNKIKTKPEISQNASRDYQGLISQTKSGLPSQESSSKSACDTLNLFAYQNTWTVVDYSVTATPQYSSGFVNGVNTYGDKAKAAYFANSNANTNVLGCLIAFSKAFSTIPSKTITIGLYTASGGIPGTLIASKTLTMQQVMSDVNGNYLTVVDFPAPFSVSGQPFFIVVNIANLNWATSHDTLSIQSNQDPETTPTATWEMQSDNLWYSYTDLSSWNLNISLAVFPVMSNTPADASFTQSATNTCAGYPVTLNAAASVQNSLAWVLAGANPPTSTIVAPTVTYANAGTYPIKLYVLGGSCNNLDSMITSITIAASPVPNASANPTSVCQGNSVLLSASGGIFYQWTGYPPSPSPTQIVSPTTTTTYTVTVTASNSCTASQNVTVTVNPPPVPNATANPSTICSVGGATLISTPPGMSSYLWSPGGYTTAAFSASPSTTTTYNVTVTDANSCTATDNVTVIVDQQMVTTTTPTDATCGYSNGTATVSITSGGTSPFYYLWSTAPPQTTALATGLAQGTYYVTVTDSYGCQSSNSTYVNCVVGLTDHTSLTDIRLIPNPSEGEFFVTLNGYNGQETSVVIFNVDGQCVYNEKFKIDADIFSENINLSLFAKGVYYIRVMTADKVKTLKLVTE